MGVTLLLVGLLSHIAMAGKNPRSELEFFKGAWTLAGHENTFKEVCDWLPGDGFVACHAEDRSETKPDYSMSIFGYSEGDDLYTYNGFNAASSQRTLRGTVHDGVWRFFGQPDRGPAWRRWQVTITPTAEGFQFREETSERGGPWKEAFKTNYVRVRNK